MPLAIVPYHPRHRQDVHHVACETAFFGRPMHEGFGQDPLLVATYAVDLYLTRHPDLTLVVEDAATGQAVGYITGTHDTQDYETFLNREFPRRVARGLLTGAMRLGPEDFKLGLKFLGFQLLGPVVDDHDTTRWPAHLHINLLAPARGKGLGRTLITAFEEKVRAKGATGLHLVTTSLNEGVEAFYGATGFDLAHRKPVPALPWLNPGAFDMLVFAKLLSSSLQS